MNKIAVFAGSFDPFTCGHKSVVERAVPLFDEIIIAIGHNLNKKGFFPVEERKKMISDIFQHNPKIKVEIYTGLTIDFCKEKNARFLLRGLRTSADFEFERPIGQVNKSLMPEIETVYLLTMPEHTFISSGIVREVLTYGGDVSQFVPKEILKYI